MSPEDSPAIKDALDNAANAIKRGDLETGKAGLKWVLEREPNNALAWLWMSHCVPNNEAKLECFNRVLAIDPSNRHALKGVQRFGAGARRGRRLTITERAQVGWGFWLWWVMASTVSLAAEQAVDSAAGGFVIGAYLGVAQWFVLRRQVSRAGWWVLASIVGLAVGFVVRGAVGAIVAGVVYGAITGGVMVWLLRQPIKGEPSLPQDAA